MNTETALWIGIGLIAVLAALYAWKHSAKPKPTPIPPTDHPRVWIALDRRVAELKAEIAKAKASKKRHSHLVAELQALMNRKLLWEQGA